jgi:hypothetical protein
VRCAAARRLLPWPGPLGHAGQPAVRAADHRGPHVCECPPREMGALGAGR